MKQKNPETGLPEPRFGSLFDSQINDSSQDKQADTLINEVVEVHNAFPAVSSIQKYILDSTKIFFNKCANQEIAPEKFKKIINDWVEKDGQKLLGKARRPKKEIFDKAIASVVELKILLHDSSETYQEVIKNKITVGIEKLEEKQRDLDNKPNITSRPKRKQTSEQQTTPLKRSASVAELDDETSSSPTEIEKLSSEEIKEKAIATLGEISKHMRKKEKETNTPSTTIELQASKLLDDNRTKSLEK